MLLLRRWIVVFRPLWIVAAPMLLRRRLDGGKRLLVGLHGKALAIEHGGLASALAFEQGRANFCSRRSVGERTCGKPKLHAKPCRALFHHDDRTQRGEFRI